MQLEEGHRQSLYHIAEDDSVPDKVRRRAYILLYKADGFSDQDIAVMLGLTRITVRRWITRYKSRDPEDKITQLLDVSKGRGRKSDFTNEEKDWIFNMIDSATYLRESESGSGTRNIKKLQSYIVRNAAKAGHGRLRTIKYRDLYKMVDLYIKRPWAHAKY